MNIFRNCFLLLLGSLILTNIAFAQDQTVIISDSPKYVEGKILDKDEDEQTLHMKATITQGNAKLLIKKVMGEDHPDKNIYYILHLVRYKDNELAVEHQNWYVYYSDWDQKHNFLYQLSDFRLAKHFEETRIFGSNKVALVYVHFNVPGATKNQISAAAQDKGFNNNDQDKIVKGIFEGEPPSNVPVQTKNGHGLIKLTEKLAIDERFLPISYRVNITKKLPDVQQSLKGIAGLVVQSGAVKVVTVENKFFTLGLGKVMDIKHQPSDMKTTALVGAGQEQKEISTQTYDNEKRYWYNFSFALPLKSFKDVTFDFQNQLVTPKKVEKQNLFAMVNVSPFKFDTKKPWAQAVPVFIYGVPITGKPLDQHLLGIALGFNYVQPYIGVHYNRTKVPRVAGATQTDDLKDRWVGKLSYGINIPVSYVVGALKTKK